MKTLLLLLCFAGQNPITGPTGGQPGNILVLDASRAKAEAYSWEVVPKLPNGELTILPMPDGKCQVCSVPHEIPGFPPGTYYIVLSVYADKKLSSYLWTVKISKPSPGPGPSPTPAPPGPGPLPPSLAGIAKVSFDEASKVSGPARSLAWPLATALRGLATEISKLATAEDTVVLAKVLETTHTVLKDKAGEWKAWGKATGAAIGTKDPNTGAEWADAIIDAAIGLEATK